MIVLSQNPVGANQTGDRFGVALAVGKFNGSIDGLIVGSPGESLSGSGANSGIFYYWQ
jgi:hypothetical protein